MTGDETALSSVSSVKKHFLTSVSWCSPQQALIARAPSLFVGGTRFSSQPLKWPRAGPAAALSVSLLLLLFLGTPGNDVTLWARCNLKPQILCNAHARCPSTDIWSWRVLSKLLSQQKLVPSVNLKNTKRTHAYKPETADSSFRPSSSDVCGGDSWLSSPRLNHTLKH